MLVKKTIIGIALFWGGIYMYGAEVVSQYGNGCLAIPGICLGLIGLAILFFELYYYHNDTKAEESDPVEKQLDNSKE